MYKITTNMKFLKNLIFHQIHLKLYYGRRNIEYKMVNNNKKPIKT